MYTILFAYTVYWFSLRPIHRGALRLAVSRCNDWIQVQAIMLALIAWYSVFKLVTFLPADCEDGQIFICGIFLAFGIGGGMFLGIFWALHVDISLAFGIARGIFWNLCAFFDIFVQQGSLVTTNHRFGWRHEENAPKKNTKHMPRTAKSQQNAKKKKKTAKCQIKKAKKKANTC